jgi:hypothetical protein
MNSLHLLSRFQQYFPAYPRSVVKNFLLLAQAFLSARSTNLNVVKDRIGALLQKERKPESHYKRLIRFFQIKEPEKLTLAILKFTFRLISGKIKYLILDSTCWDIGSKNVHLQVLCIIYKEIAIPIYWKDLDHDGHSGTGERIELLSAAAKQFDLKGKVLLADREYCGDNWLRHLVDLGIDFVVRLPQRCCKNQVASYCGLQKKALQRKRAVATPVLWQGYQVQLVIKKNTKDDPKEPLLYWITSLSDHIKACEDYRKRWKIERCFKCLKSNGFNIQQLNFKKPAKVNLLFAIVVFAYVLSLMEGLKKKVAVKRYKNGKQGPAVSPFRLGLQHISALLVEFAQFLSWLRTYYYPPTKAYQQNVLCQ